MKPIAESCLQNRDPILTVIKPLFAAQQAVLEIGSGTGQHAVYFAAEMPHLVWHTSDQPQYHQGIQQWVAEAALPNVLPPLTLDVLQPEWPVVTVDTVFSANTLHIMSWPMVQAFFQGAGCLLPRGGLLVVYGPFNYGGQYTSDSNARFDRWLAIQNPESAIRNFEAVQALAEAADLRLQQDYAMPANNRILCWQKS